MLKTSSVKFNEDGKSIVKNQGIANTFKNYSGSVVEKLNEFQWYEHRSNLNSKILKSSLKRSKTIPGVT